MYKNFPQKISVIVPFHNEELTVGHVAKVLTSISYLDEVIFVDDGSIDKSNQIVSQYKDKLHLITLNKNKGKGEAVYRGIKACKGDIVLFIDADLSSLSAYHIKKLLVPFVDGKCDAVVGYPVDNILDIFFVHYGGQRLYHKKDLVNHYRKIRNSRKWGLEAVLNKIFENKKVMQIPLKRLGHIEKTRKRKGIALINELINWSVDVGSELFKQEVIDVDDFIELVKIKGLKTKKTLLNKLRKIKSKKLDKYILSYIKKSLEN